MVRLPLPTRPAGRPRLTTLVEPLNARPPPYRPAAQAAADTAPVAPLPEASAATAPLPSSNAYAAARPATCDATVTAPVPLKAPDVARTVADPVPVAGAVYRPVAPTPPSPPESTDQVNAGWLARAWPNWSRAVAVNCCVAPLPAVTELGLTATLVNVCATVTLTSLVADRPVASVMVARRV